MVPGMAYVYAGEGGGSVNNADQMRGSHSSPCYCCHDGALYVNGL